MKALISGLGSIGTRHAKNLVTLGVTDLIGVDPDKDRRDRFCNDLPGVTLESFVEALSQKPDLAVIASPNRFHIEQALLAADHGCHLLIEKPLGDRLEGVDQLIERVEDKQIFAHMGSNWKFHPAFQKMKDLLADGVIGTVTGAQVLSGQWLPDWHPWEDYRNGYSARKDLGGGVVLDSHEFDYVTWLLGPIDDVQGYAVRSPVLETETPNVACACLKMKSGALVTIHIDYIQRSSRRRYHLSGDEGTIEWDLKSENVSLFRAATGDTEHFETPLGDVNDMYLEQTRHVLNGLAKSEPPVTPLLQARDTLSAQLALMN
jgi:predicted dehydrogenase